MTKPTFNVEKRETTGKGVARKLRMQNLIPGVCYGDNNTAQAVTADPHVLYKLLTGEFKTNIVFALNIEGGDTIPNVMVRDYQIDPVRRTLLHADFVAVDGDKNLKVNVPIKFEGRPVGVKAGGRFQTIRDDISVWCKPADIPACILLKTDDLKMEDSVMASGLTLPDGVLPAYKVDYTTCRVARPRGAEEVKEDAGVVAAAEGDAAAKADA